MKDVNDVRKAGLPFEFSGKLIQNADGSRVDGSASDDDTHVVIDDTVVQLADEIAQALPARESLPDGVAHESDLANAYRLWECHGNDLRFVAGLGWLSWNGRCWQRSEANTDRAGHFVLETGREFVQRGAQMLALLPHDRPKLKRAVEKVLLDKHQRDVARESDHAVKIGESLQSMRSVSATLAAARTLPLFSARVDDLDRDPWLFNVANGTLDLRTLVLREQRRDDLITRESPVTFDLDAIAPLWDQFQTEVHTDAEVRAFNQRFYGYAMTGITAEHVMAVAHGGGSNGKSTECEVIRYVLGDYAAEAAGGTFVAGRQQGRSVDNKLAKLRGARLVTTAESAEGCALNEDLIKRTTGGDTVTANLLYQEPFEYIPTYKVRLTTNHRPEVHGTDDGIWRRLRLIPYSVSFEGRADPELPAKLKAEAPGVLGWLLRGCLDWQRQRLNPPKAVLAVAKEWRDDANEVHRFVDECCTRSRDAKYVTGDLYAAYRSWAAREGRDPLTSNKFGRRLTELGFEQCRTTTQRFRLGIALTQRAKPTDGDVYE